jgi:hypothetical protein
MITSRRRLSGLALGLLGATGLAGCVKSATPATHVSEAQALVNDAAAILALGIIPGPAAGIAALVVSGLQALLATISGSIATGASPESTIIASLASSMQSLQKAVPPGSQVYNYAAAAITALGNLGANASASAQAQVEGAVGQALIAYLELTAPKSARYGASAAPLTGLLTDAKLRIARLGGTL